MTPLKSLANQCGLSLKETAAYTGLPESTATAYWKGYRPTAPPRALRKLRTLAAQIETLAAEITEGILGYVSEAETPPSKILLTLVSTGRAAQALRLPYASCHEATLSRVLASLPSPLVPLVAFREAMPGLEDVEIL